MTKAKAFWILLGVLLVLVLSHGSYNLCRSESSLGFTTTSGVRSNDGPGLHTCEHFAVITPPTDRSSRLLQSMVAEELVNWLSNATVIPAELDSTGGGMTRIAPKVILCKSVEEAREQGADFCVTVEPASWKCTWFAFWNRRWDGELKITGASATGETPKSNRQGSCYYHFDMRYSLRGRMTGLFTGRHLVEQVAGSVSKSAGEGITKLILDNTDNWLEKNRKGNT